VEDGEIVYGEFKTGDEAKEAKAVIKELPTDLSELLDREVQPHHLDLCQLVPRLPDESG
jgi:hypothetical protein